jgi:hypothetical protein
MQRSILAAAVLAALHASAAAAQPKWERDLRQMGYLFLHISNINVVNGLNLTREQAAELRRLALQVEAAAPRPPSLRGPIAPELGGVRKTWLELRTLLVRNEPVPEELQSRVNLSRAEESRVIRATLRPAPVGSDTRCASCHQAPASGRAFPAAEPMAVTALNKRQVELAHIEGLYGERGLAKLLAVSPRVEALLTDAQKSILGSFSCCLVPPQDLRDPVRAGQAESDEKVLDLLRKVRQCPEKLWPMMREGILQRVGQIADAVSPAATPERKATAREGVAAALDRARGLSDVAFELEKDALAKAAKGAILPPSPDAPHKAAYFLLIPGSSAVYAQYLKRLASQGAAR